MKKALLILLLVVSVLAGKCSHIVGGELYYNCLGNNQYKITLKLYRDCNCQNCAAYGNPEYVTIFDVNGNVVAQPSMFFPGADTLNPAVTNPCMQQPDVCVEQAVYSTTVTLNPGAGGLDIVYQRCCRNVGVVNLVPGQGATYTAHIPDPALAQCNSSPRFNSLPPLYLCVNAPIAIDYSATDPNGDSLVYSLCDPYNGSDINSSCPDPSPNANANGNPNNCPTAPNAPPYTPASYAPPYNSSNFTNSPSNSFDLSIDPHTGLLTGTPNTQGLFDVTVCVSEYRNGQLLGVLRRDFQFTVTQCNVPIPAVPIIGTNNGQGIYTINCKSLTVTFQNNTVNPISTDTLSFSWNFGVSGSTTDTSTEQYPTYTFPDSGTYHVRLIAIESGGGLTTTCQDTQYVLVYLYPTLTSGFETSNICQDSAARFLDQSTSTSGPVNLWYWNFGDGSVSTQQNPSHLFSVAGTYDVTLIAMNIHGCRDTTQHNITIYPITDASFIADSSICFGNTSDFINTSTGPPATYQWNFGDGSNSTTRSPVYNYPTTGTFAVSLITQTLANGCKDTTVENIAVHPLPVISIPNDTTICPYTSVQLSASGGAQYVWSPATGLNDSSIANPLATPPPPNSIVYTVVVTSQFSCVSSDSMRVSFYPLARINAGPDTSVCLNFSNFHDSVQLTATGGVSYVWTPATGLSNPNIGNPLAKPTANTTYTVLGTDVNGCTASDSLTIFVLDPSLNLILQSSVSVCVRDTAYATIVNQGASAYNWTPSTYLTNPGSWNTGFYPPDTTNYILTVSNYCYTKSDSVLVIIWPIPQLGLNPLDSVCIGQSIQLNAQNATAYQWNADPTLSSTTIANPIATPTANTKYIVTGTNQYGCVNKDSTEILVYLPSIIQAYPKDTPFICRGTSARLLATGAYSYVWSPASTLNNPNIANPIATPTDTTQYNVVATNVHGCKSYDSLVIKVQQPVTASVQAPADVCRGIPVHLTASGGPYFSWTPSTGLNDTVDNGAYALPDSSTYYVVKVFNDCFSDTAGVEVTIEQIPEVSAGNDTTIWRDTHAQLNGFTNVSSYFWDPSTWIDNAFDLHTTVDPPQTTRYYLFATSSFGCINVDSVLITVVPHTELDIPTGFSPNGDGVNDVFHIVRSLNIDHLSEFAVYNRWGEKIFSTDNINVGWDGTFAGKPCPMDVYVWMVIAETHEGKQIVRKGNVTLLR